jgi:hypothetical protein
MPTWVRIVAALGIAAFLLSMLGGLFRASAWWQASGLVFVIAFAAVAYYRMRHEGEDAIKPEDEADAGASVTSLHGPERRDQGPGR